MLRETDYKAYRERCRAYQVAWRQRKRRGEKLARTDAATRLARKKQLDRLAGHRRKVRHEFMQLNIDQFAGAEVLLGMKRHWVVRGMQYPSPRVRPKRK